VKAGQKRPLPTSSASSDRTALQPPRRRRSDQRERYASTLPICALRALVRQRGHPRPRRHHGTAPTGRGTIRRGPPNRAQPIRRPGPPQSVPVSFMADGSQAAAALESEIVAGFRGTEAVRVLRSLQRTNGDSHRRSLPQPRTGPVPSKAGSAKSTEIQRDCTKFASQTRETDSAAAERFRMVLAARPSASEVLTGLM